MTQLTISQLGKKVGLTPKTIRFYETEGVIPQAQRAENGYRMYDESVIPQLTLISQARELGLPLSQIQKLIGGCENNSCKHTKDEVQENLNEYIDLLTAKIGELVNLKEKLLVLHTQLVSQADSCSGGVYCCNFLYQLQHLQEGGEKNMNKNENCTCCGTSCTCSECSC